MPTEGHTMAADGQMSLACFELDGRCFGIDVANVREVVRWKPITPLPLSPPLIEGVVELRNGLVPVLDLGRALGGEPVVESTDARIAVLDVDGMSLGLCVQAATDVLSIDPGAVEDVPELARQAGYEAVKAVVRRPNAEPVMVLSVEELLESVYRSALPQQGVG
jgi:purine-binding chemotaxis protein CheW